MSRDHHANEIDTILQPVDASAPDPTLLAQAAAILQQGGLVAFPTETVYGLGANALNATAVARIFAAKERPSHDPIIVHVADAADLARVARDVPPVARALADRFWPGPLTLVLPRSARVPAIVTAGGDTVAVRCPQHPLALALIQAAGVPIAAPSANRFSRTSPTTAQHVWDDLAGRIEMILDGGPTPIGVESTVLDVMQPTPEVLRPGGVTVEALTAVLGEVTLRRRDGRPQTHLPSPGMLDKHYAPRADLWLFTGADEAVQAAMQAALTREVRNGRRVGLLLAKEDRASFAAAEQEPAVVTATVGSLTELAGSAQQLFSSMRRLDATGVDLILARDFPAHGLGVAIRDRLRRAAVRLFNTDAST